MEFRMSVSYAMRTWVNWRIVPLAVRSCQGKVIVPHAVRSPSEVMIVPHAVRSHQKAMIVPHAVRSRQEELAKVMLERAQFTIKADSLKNVHTVDACREVPQ